MSDLAYMILIMAGGIFVLAAIFVAGLILTHNPYE